jgi:hypothetical protein
MERRLHLFLRVKNPRFCAHRMVLRRDHTDLDNRAAEITVEHFQPAPKDTPNRSSIVP